MRVSIVAVALFASTLAASAQGGGFFLSSYGRNSCGSYAHASKQEKQSFLAWTEGFISGINYNDRGKGRSAGMGSYETENTAWLQNYCAGHPTDPFLVAVSKLRVRLGGNPQAQPN